MTEWLLHQCPVIKIHGASETSPAALNERQNNKNESLDIFQNSGDVVSDAMRDEIDSYTYNTKIDCPERLETIDEDEEAVLDYFEKAVSRVHGPATRLFIGFSTLNLAFADGVELSINNLGSDSGILRIYVKIPLGDHE